MKSIYYPESALRLLRTRSESWAAAWRKQTVAAAEPWRGMSDANLWALVFSHRLTRAWQVWSNGHCPVCRTPLPEYTWAIDALARPWKARCPKCEEVFPKNDFAAFHRSGLDEAGLFDPARADRRLLFHADHPDPADPLHTYGVDDGEGWSDGENRWRFIAAYLIYGQWKQMILGGIVRCAAAYLATDRLEYAHKALLLLDRVADVYPSMDFSTQGLVYETRYPSAGYVSVWHDACAEAASLALAYDAVRPALHDAGDLVAFLRGQAARFRLVAAKDSPDAIRDNIEGNLLRHTIDHEERIKSNFPTTDLTVLRIHSILDAAGTRDVTEPRLDSMLDRATAVDGVTGEKGLNGYAAWTSSGVFSFMAHLALTDEARFRGALARHPRIHDGVRFFLDTWCLRKFYPSCGDAGAFAQPQHNCAALNFESYRAEPNAPESGRQLLPQPSPHALLWALYKATGDVDMLRLSRMANDSPDGQLRFGLLGDPAPEEQAEYQRILMEQGADIKQVSIDKREWHVAILRSGAGAHERALWLDYDTGRNHHHFDGMNLGLFAFGLDLLPDFGYPPTGYGGHETREAMWYVHTAAHNTVVVDGKCQPGPHWTREILAAGRNDLWLTGGWTQGLRNNAPGMYAETTQYERTLWLTDVGESSFYVLDIFRVLGGSDHAKLTHSGMAVLDAPGLKRVPVENFIADSLLRNFNMDRNAPSSWTADFRIEDPHNYRQTPGTVRLRAHDLTPETEAGTVECWVNDGGYNASSVIWIPALISRRRSPRGGLASTFVAILEPYESEPSIRTVRRTGLETADGNALGPAHVAVAAELGDGRTDYYVMLNTGPHHGEGAAWRPGIAVRVPEWGLETDAEACVLRRGPAAPKEPILFRGTYARMP